MKYMRIVTMLISFAFGILIAQEISNVQFTDLNGKNYDLYNLLDQGTHVVVHTQYNS